MVHSGGVIEKFCLVGGGGGLDTRQACESTAEALASDRVRSDRRRVDLEVELDAIAGRDRDRSTHIICVFAHTLRECHRVDSQPFESFERRVAVIGGDAEQHERPV